MVIFIHLMTINEISMYGLASFKIIIFNFDIIDVNYFKLGFSALVLVYYIGYIVRLIVACKKYKGTKEENRQFLILFSCMEKAKKKSVLSRCYIPFMLLRSFIMALALVGLSSNAGSQIGAVVGIFLIWCLYSFCYCPYLFYIRIFIRLY